MLLGIMRPWPQSPSHVGRHSWRLKSTDQAAVFDELGVRMCWRCFLISKSQDISAAAALIKRILFFFFSVSWRLQLHGRTNLLNVSEILWSWLQSRDFKMFFHSRIELWNTFCLWMRGTGFEDLKKKKNEADHLCGNIKRSWFCFRKVVTST